MQTMTSSFRYLLKMIDCTVWHLRPTYTTEARSDCSNFKMGGGGALHAPTIRFIFFVYVGEYAIL